MRRIPLILGLALIVGLIIRDIYEFFVTNEGVRYFSSAPRRLLYVLLLGIGGGIVALVISRLSPASQRRLKLVALGGFGCLLLAATSFFAYVLCSLPAAPLTEAHLRGAVAAVFCSIAAVAVLVWLEFRQVWRQAK